ncbi:MAG: coagulation factor 5/8 type domain-containing protein, partial [Cryomorphaceae bacterium]|nr:coagulation factor 5/8 type domain-containing protein [Cryomorphaceae bacterium]
MFGFSHAQVYYVSSTEGSDQNDGVSIEFPFQSIDKLNSMVFSAGDSIYFKSGDYWEGMFWLKGSGTTLQPIVIDVYGGSDRPIIDGYGYQ